MKIPKMIFIVFLLAISSQLSTMANQGYDKSTKAVLKGVDAKTALKIANQWKWTKKEIKSYVNTREVVFKFPDGKIKKIPLPDNEIMVAVAPYIKNTHD